MKRDTIVRSEYDPDDPPKMPSERRRRLQAMTDEEVEAAAAADPDNLPWSEEELAGADRAAADVAALRRRLGLTQAAFAARYRIPVGTLRDWEQGRKEPERAARLLLRIIAYDPETAARALV